MKLIGLVSGGKDGIYNLISCLEYGHEIVCLANLFPPKTDELNSHMFQTVGHEAVELIATAMGLPLIRKALCGQSLNTTLHYEKDDTLPDGSVTANYDEIDDLYQLIVQAKADFPEAQGVATGAILSNYQRIRVERVCSQLGLTSYSYLWQRDQVELLHEMCTSGKITPTLIKLASPSLPPQPNLMKTLQELQPTLLTLFDQYGMNVCGEGGEYESLVLDSCIQNKRIQVEKFTIVDAESIGPDGQKQVHLSVPYVHLNEISLVDKANAEIDAHRTKLSPHAMNFQCEPISFSHCGPLGQNQVPCTCNSSAQSTPSVAIPFSLTLPALDRQIEANLKSLRPSQSISRLCLFSRDITELFAAFQSFVRQAQTCYNTPIRPVFVMICIPDMSQFGAMNIQYSSVFPTIRPPARVCIQSSLPYYTLDTIFITSRSNNTQHIESCHVESVSTWAPANIGPYSQYWRLNGLFLGAGQIGLFPPTMTLYNCVAKQFLQTIKNAVACLQSASELHQLNSRNHVLLQHTKSPQTTSSFGQFTSMLLTFDEKQVLRVMHAILTNYPQSQSLSMREQVEIFLAVTNALTAAPSRPVLSPDTNFDPIPLSLPPADNQTFSSTRGLLFNHDKETHQSLSRHTRQAEIISIAEHLLNGALGHFLPPIITTFDSDYAQSSLFSSDDQRDDLQQQPSPNSSAVMIFVSAEMLPRAAAFELCAVGITNHVFKALSCRVANSKLPRLLSQLRWVYIDPTYDDRAWIIFAIFLPSLYLDVAIFQLSSDGVNPPTFIPTQLLNQLYSITKCHPVATSATNPPQHALLSVVQSKLFVPLAHIPNALSTSTELCTSIYPSTPLFDQLNFHVANLYADVYLRLLHQKSKQFQAVRHFMSQNPSLSPQDIAQDDTLFFPRPSKPNSKCLCQVFNQNLPCSICRLQTKFDGWKLDHVHHTLLADPDLLTSLE